jgi:ribonuclease BN (tRNA processing enzyme)
MRFTVLGCSGGVGSGRQTTCFRLDADVLIDAGTGVFGLELEELVAIDQVFLTHSHLDHVVGLPLLVDSVAHLRQRPLVVHAIAQTREVLQRHVFNGQVWPDFTRIPDPRSPCLVFADLTPAVPVAIGAGREVTALPARHSVPAVGFQVRAPGGSLVFGGDSTGGEDFWEAVNRIEDLRYLLVETAFSEERREIALASMHLSPGLLAQQLALLHRRPQIYITHLKPGEEERTLAQIARMLPGGAAKPLVRGQELSL